MSKNRTVRSNERRRCTPAFLTSNHRGLETTGHSARSSRSCWKPEDKSRRMTNALEVLPKLASQIGFAIAAHPNASIDVLPGSPTTVVFSVNSELKGLMVLPIDEDEARRQLGLPTITTTDLICDTLFEEERQGDMLQPDEQLDALCDQLQ